MSTANDLVPSSVIVVATPEIFSLLVKLELGFITSFRPFSCISNTPSSNVAPNLFLIPLSNLREAI